MRDRRSAAIQRVVVAVDFSPGTWTAIEYAAVVAEALGASVHLLHVLEEPTLGPWGADGHDLLSQREQAMLEARTRLEAMASGFARTRVTTDVRAGRPGREIVSVADARGADLIVMGTRRRRWSRLTHSSVTAYVVRHAGCPVLEAGEAGAPHTAVARELALPGPF